MIEINQQEVGLKLHWWKFSSVAGYGRKGQIRNTKISEEVNTFNFVNKIL
jgi:hypothetical protein